jgi:hypothetical protein
MADESDVGKWIAYAIIAFLLWTFFQNFSSPSSPSSPQQGEICEYFDADPTQWTDMQLECYEP